MREILFRGKTLNGNEWVIGAGVYKSEGYTWIITDDVTKTENRGTGSDAIIPETVGQYTGLTDKNGKKIFEGDIVQYYGTYALEVFIENGHTKIRWFDTVMNGEYDELFFGFDESLGECEVIGNIHDNPELLEGGVVDG